MPYTIKEYEGKFLVMNEVADIFKTADTMEEAEGHQKILTERELMANEGQDQETETETETEQDSAETTASFVEDEPDESLPDPTSDDKTETQRNSLIVYDKRVVLESVELIDMEEANEDNVIKNVTLITPGWSQNGRYYSKEVLKRAIPKFEMTRSYVDHGEKNPIKRSVLDQVGYFSEVWQDNLGSIKGNWNLIGERGKTEHVKEWANASKKSGKTFMGLSIVAALEVGQGYAEGKRGSIVKDLLFSHSVDVVNNPSAGGTFVGSESSSDITASLLGELSFEEWKDARTDYVDTLKNELKQVRQEAAVKERDQKIVDLSTEMEESSSKVTALESSVEAKDSEITSLKEKVKESLAAKVLIDSRLPSDLYDGIKPQLVEVETEEEMKTLVEAKIEEVEKITKKSSPTPTDISKYPTIESKKLAVEVDDTYTLRYTGIPNQEGESAEEYKSRVRQIQKEKAKEISLA